MNVFHKTALQSLIKSRTRTLVTVVGVILSAAMITGIATFGVSLLDYMTKGAQEKYGNWHAAFLNADQAFVLSQRENDWVSECTAFDNIGYAQIENSKNPEKPYIFLAGYNESTADTLPVTILNGKMPENSGEALISGKLAADAGVKLSVGDTVTFKTGSRMSRDGKKLCQGDPYEEDESFVPDGERTYRIVGVCQRPLCENDSAPGYTLITRTSGELTNDCSAFVTLKNPGKIHSYIQKYSRGRSVVLNDYVLRFMGLSDNNIFNNLLYAVGGIVIAIIMTGSVFLIYNSFNISLNERTQQFGIMMSVGATAKQLRNSVLFEGMCIGAAGIPAGMLCGIGGIRIVIDMVARKFTNILYDGVPLAVKLSAPALIASAVLSLLTILISAYIPAGKALKMPVMECIRQTNEIKVESKAVRTSALAQRIYGLEGTLALKNFKRNKKRYQSIVLSLVLSVTLFISASAFVTDMKNTTGDRTEVTTYDIALAAKDLDDSEIPELFDKVKNADHITKASWQETVYFTCTAKISDMTSDYFDFTGTPDAGSQVSLPARFQFIDDTAFKEILSESGLEENEYFGENGKLLAVAQVEKGGECSDLFKTASLTMNAAPQSDIEQQKAYSKTFTFIKIVPPDSIPVVTAGAEQTPVFFEVMIPYSLKDSFTIPESAVEMKGMTFESDNSAKSCADIQTIMEGAGVTADYSIYNMNKMMDENRNLIFIANVFAITFITMISLIAVANVFNTISTNIRLRRRELAMLRSVGMSERDFQKMMNFECAFYGMRALVIGLPTATIAAWLIHKAMFTDGVAFRIPWASIGISIFGVLFIVFVTMLYSVSRIKRENIIDALRDDMT